MKEFSIIIPAHYDSKRLPGKLLLKKEGYTLLNHVYDNVNADCVATESPEIIEEVKKWNGNYIETGRHKNGLSRLVEVTFHLNSEIFVNVQGDEPEIYEEDVQRLISALKRSNCPVATLACKFDNGGDKDLQDTSQVKVVLNNKREALYFSRAAIPGYYHIGIYAYYHSFLSSLLNLPNTYLAEREGLEQLKILELGYNIQVEIINKKPLGINTQEDYEKWLNN